MSGESLSLTDAVAVMAERMAAMDTDDVWLHFTCGEIEAVADVLRAAGHDDVAAFIVSEHAIHDDVDDDFHGGVS